MPHKIYISLSRGSFTLSGDSMKDGTITLQCNDLSEIDLSERTVHHSSEFQSTVDLKTKESHLSKSENKDDLELFGPKPKFVNDILGKEKVKLYYRIKNVLHLTIDLYLIHGFYISYHC